MHLTRGGPPRRCVHRQHGCARAEVCQRWLCDRADLSEGVWTGDVDSCDPGDNTIGRANALEVRFVR